MNNNDIGWNLYSIPEHPELGDLVDVSGISRKWLDVPYASESESQKLDIYLPEEGEGPFPTYIFVHGGAFLFGMKNDVQFLLGVDGVNRGYAVVSVEYRRAPEAKAPAALYDIKAAIRFLRAHANEYHLDPFMFALGGDSAGAYYSVFAAATQDIAAFDGPNPENSAVSSAVRAVVAQCGVYDLLTLTPPYEIEASQPPDAVNEAGIPLGMMTIFLGANTHQISEISYLLNPVNFITPTFPQTLIEVGDSDMIVPYTESEKLYQKICKECGEDRVEFMKFAGWNHCATNHIITRDWFVKENQDRVFGFLDSVMK